MNWARASESSLDSFWVGAPPRSPAKSEKSYQFEDKDGILRKKTFRDEEGKQSEQYVVAPRKMLTLQLSRALTISEKNFLKTTQLQHYILEC